MSFWPMLSVQMGRELAFGISIGRIESVGWALVISADNVNYMDHLRNVRGSFECPPADLG